VQDLGAAEECSCWEHLGSGWTLCDLEGPKWRTKEEGSEWEPIKILLEGDRGCNKMNTTSNTRL
jgi:hypothetical protein